MELTDNKNLIASEIHKTPVKAVIIATGGGTGIFPFLLERGGGSKTLLAGIIPYDHQETISLLAGKPDKFVSEHTARSLAMAAYMKAKKLCPDTPVIGIACTASLQTIPGSEERVGRKHLIYLALQTAIKTVAVTIELEQFDGRNAVNDLDRRLVEENLCVEGILQLLAEGCQAKYYCALTTDGKVTRTELEDESFGALLDKSSSMVTYPGSGGTNPKVIFSGSFNPIHNGHLEMVSIIRNNPKIKDKDKTVGFEISMFNAEKPPLDFITINERVQQFKDIGETVHITNAPMFIEKSNLFKNHNFIVGYDTALRILDPKFVGPIDNVLKTFKQNGNYFYIFPRNITLVGSFGLPGEYVTDERQFEHVSSSDLRKEVTK